MKGYGSQIMDDIPDVCLSTGTIESAGQEMSTIMTKRAASTNLMICIKTLNILELQTSQATRSFYSPLVTLSKFHRDVHQYPFHIAASSPSRSGSSFHPPTHFTAWICGECEMSYRPRWPRSYKPLQDAHRLRHFQRPLQPRLRQGQQPDLVANPQVSSH